MDRLLLKARRGAKRRARVRGTVVGTAERPRLTVNRSLKNIYAQLIDDSAGRTIIGLGTLSKALRDTLSDGNKVEQAKKVGLALAEMAKEQGITEVVFDRNRYRYFGRVRAVADGAREGGLKF